jgi:hypothetical protein
MSTARPNHLASPPDDRPALLQRIAVLEARVAELEEQLAQRDARLADLEAERDRQGKRYRRRTQRTRRVRRHDRRRRRYRKHPGRRRPLPLLGEDVIHHDVRPTHCPHCGSNALEPTDQFTDH